jgi:hypothetical protein
MTSLLADLSGSNSLASSLMYYGTGCRSGQAAASRDPSGFLSNGKNNSRSACLDIDYSNGILNILTQYVFLLMGILYVRRLPASKPLYHGTARRLLGSLMKHDLDSLLNHTLPYGMNSTPFVQKLLRN